MATYRIEFVKSAKKEFEVLPQKIKTKVIEVLSFLAQNPYSEFFKVKKLKGVLSLYRIRISDYRIVYEIRNKTLVIVIIKIGHRKEVYRKF